MNLLQSSMSIRAKLMSIFLATKVLPLILIAGIAWLGIQSLAGDLTKHITAMAEDMRQTLEEVGEKATNDSIRNLDLRAQEAIERLTQDTAKDLAAFLYDRDADILMAAQLEPSEQNYRRFLETRRNPLTIPEAWELSADGTRWQAPAPIAPLHPGSTVSASLDDNKKNFSYRPANKSGRKQVDRPLFVEMTFVALDGQETIKISTSNLLPKGLRDISQRENTWSKAETYFAEVSELNTGEISVSEMIGPYIPAHMIGPYTQERAAKQGIDFAPEESAYAGKENPRGKRFRGIIRWATPVERQGKIIGHVTLALDHDHIQEFTDYLLPTDDRNAAISDAGNGNYAFIWDYNGRNISHPRDYFIVGYNPDTGQPEVPWLEADIYQRWQQSGQSYVDFIAKEPRYDSQSLTKKPSKELIQQGLLGLDCRWLNFAPQCTGWRDLTAAGGSGSFVIRWSGLWKLTTAAAIPYYTGRYGKTGHGLGWVTIGANVREFHSWSEHTKNVIEEKIAQQNEELHADIGTVNRLIGDSLQGLIRNLGLTTALMIAAVIGIALWLASIITQSIRSMIDGIKCFQQGHMSHRLTIRNRDEMGQLADSFNGMACSVEESFQQLQGEIAVRKQTERELSKSNEELDQRVAERTQDLSHANERLQIEINDRIEIQARIEHMALHDSLTGLANRALYQDMLKKALAFALRTDTQIALLFIDLNKFKPINDNVGHDAGDALLKHVANGLQRSIRETDTVARLGGDEFAIIVSCVNNTEGMTVLVKRILNAIKRPLLFKGQELSVGASIGISIFPDHAFPTQEDVPTFMFKNADLAMYEAKLKGDGYCFYTPAMRTKEAIEIEGKLNENRTPQEETSLS